MTNNTFEKTLNAINDAWVDSGAAFEWDTVKEAIPFLIAAGTSFLETAADYLEKLADELAHEEDTKDESSEPSLEDILNDPIKSYDHYFSQITEFLTRDQKLDGYHGVKRDK